MPTLWKDISANMERFKDLLLLLLPLLLSAAAGWIVNDCRRRHPERSAAESKDPGPHCDTLRLTITATVPYYKPVPRDSVVVQYVTARLPIHSNSHRIGKNDSAAVAVPITRKVYADSSYRAVVSGYRASLDSLLVFPPREMVTITKTIKPRRWNFGLQGGIGLTPKGLQPYIGVGLQYKF